MLKKNPVKNGKKRQQQHKKVAAKTRILINEVVSQRNPHTSPGVGDKDMRICPMINIKEMAKINVHTPERERESVKEMGL